MKKAFLTSILVVCSTLALQAGTSVTWYFDYGMFPHNSVDLVSGSGVAASQDILWQLVYAGPNNQLDDISAGQGLGNAVNGYVASGSDDQVLFSRTVPMGGGTALEDGNSFGEWLDGFPSKSENATTLPVGSLLYMRVFEGPTPVDGTYFWESTSTLAWENKDLTDPFRVSQVFQGNTAAGAGDMVNQQIQIVPEPSTVALVLLGLGIVGYRRFKNA